MSELTPCPRCQRHVRNTDLTCPFCEQALTRAGLPARPLPRTRLGRAATFAFGATLLSTTAFGCGGESESKKGGGAGTSSGGSASGGNALGGTAPGGVASGGTLSGGGGELTGGTGVVPPYGSPPVPEECDAAGGTLNGVGCESDVAGAPAAGSGQMGGFTGIPR